MEAAGLKNRRVGGARVSDRHANVIVTEAGATASDVLALLAMMRAEVAEMTGVELEMEVEVWE